MAHKKHPQPIARVLSLVKRLYNFEKLNTTDLASEYSENRRTLHRDMQKISEVIPLLNNRGTWQLDRSSEVHTSFNYALLHSFAKNVEINAECLERTNITKEMVSFAVEYKHLPKKLGEAVVQSIQDEVQSTFSYTKSDGITTRVVDAIKIYTENGRWYVIAKDYKDSKVKSFNLEKITQYKQLEVSQTLSQAELDVANGIKSVWSSNSEGFIVKLFIDPSISAYIKELKLHKTQTIEDEHYDGGLEVHCTITHKLELLPHIKYWLPRVFVLEPEWLREELLGEISYYEEEAPKMRY